MKFNFTQTLKPIILLVAVLFCARVQAQTISTFAGGYGDELSATANGVLSQPISVLVSPSGNYIIADYYSSVIRKVIVSTGQITRVAGVYYSMASDVGRAGDGGLAANAAIDHPSCMAYDRYGNLYFGESTGYIRKIDTSGIITTIAGNGGGYSGDGSVAISSGIGYPNAITIDTLGRIYISTYQRVRLIDTSGIITTIVGTGTGGYSGDGGPATAATFDEGYGLVIDTLGNLYVADAYNNNIRKVNTSGIISTFASSVAANFLTLDAAGNLYCSDNSAQVFKVSTSGTVSLFAGSTSSSAAYGDGGPATNAGISRPRGITFNGSGEMLITQDGHVRKVNTLGTISTIAGRFDTTTVTGDSINFLQANFSITTMCVDPSSGNIYFISGNVIKKMDLALGYAYIYAGQPSAIGYAGDGGPATAALLHDPEGVACDRFGNLYIADHGNHHVRKVSTSGIITTIAGGGSSGPGDGGPATAAEVIPYGICVGSSGNIFVADPDNGRVRRIDGTTGTITSIITGAGLTGGIKVDNYDNLYVQLGYWGSDFIKVDRYGTVIRSFIDGYVFRPAFDVDSVGNFYYKSQLYNGIIQLDTNFYSHPVAGNGLSGYTGDGGSATLACIATDPILSTNTAIAMNNRGELYACDALSGAIRKISGLTNFVDSPPLFAGGFSQNLLVCAGAASAPINSLLTVSDGNIGDTLRWTVSLAPYHGTITGLPVFTLSTGGVVTLSGINYVPDTGYSGPDNFRISISDGMDANTTSISVNVSPPTNAGTIMGSTTVCIGTVDSLWDETATAPGRWLSVNSLATIDTVGNINGITPGTDTILYIVSNSCGTDTATALIHIFNPFSSTIISGPTTVCTGTSASYAATVAGGTWSSADPYVTVGSGSGVVSGVATGVAVITYSVSSACGSAVDTALVNVNHASSAGTISGSSTVCVGGSTTLSTTGTGGTWSSSNLSIATISSTGVVTGVSGGAALISYTITSACGTTIAIALINVTGSSAIGSITGPSSVCSGSTITLSHATSGGTWGSSTVSVATISSGGVVTGVSPGVATISYTVSAGCGVSIATTNITVNASPVAGTTSGPSSLCVGASSTVTSSASGGSWSTASGSIASVSTVGVVTGISAGTAVFTYSVTNSCGTDAATYSLTISNSPVAGTISGASSACPGASVTMSTTGTGGTWGSSAPSVATISTTGVVTAIAAGTATLSYTVTTGCGTATATFGFTVNTLSAGTITGVTTICVGATSTLSSTVSGGTWSSSTVSVATISSSGIVTAIASGTSVISYSVTGACGTVTASAVFTVNTAPTVAAIAGATTLCVGATTALTDGTAGGAWSGSAASIATVSSTGIVTGVSAGTATISYTVTGTCGSSSATAVVTVEASPSAGAISGAATLCSGTTATLTETVTGGTWGSSAPGIAAISATGLLTGVANGAAIISYSVTNSCGTAYATHAVSVTTVPVAGVITGITSFCEGIASTLADTTTGGTWASSNPAVAVVSAMGIVTGVSAGSTVISYTVSNACGSASATTTVTVNPLPYIGAISGASTVAVGGATILVDAVSGGTWTSSNTAVATVNTVGVVTGVAAGSAVITYTLVNTYGCTTDTTFVITVTPPTGVEGLAADNGYRLFPNPTNGQVTISWFNNTGKSAWVTLTDAAGKVVLKELFAINATEGAVTINTSAFTAGIYVVAITGEGGSYRSKLILE